MFSWFRRMLRRRSGTPTDERSTQAVRLDRAEAEVQAQTAQVRRIRLQAAEAERRFRQ